MKSTPLVAGPPGSSVREELKDQDRALADRLVNYSDAMVAAVFVGVSGLGVAIADPDTRASVASGAVWVAVTYVLLGGIVSTLLHLLRRWERDLRAGAPPSAKAERYSRNLHFARFVITWVSVTQSIVLLLLIR